MMSFENKINTVMKNIIPLKSLRRAGGGDAAESDTVYPED